MIPAVIGAAGTIGGSIIGNQIAASSARAINEAQLKNQRDMYTEQINLANTAHQREVADLRLAGLNPILSAQGSGAASPAAPSVDLMNPDASFASMGHDFHSAAKGFEGAIGRTLQRAQAGVAIATADNTATNAEVARLELKKKQMELDYIQKHPNIVGRVLENNAQPRHWYQDLMSRVNQLFGSREVIEAETGASPKFDPKRNFEHAKLLSAPDHVNVGGELYKLIWPDRF